MGTGTTGTKRKFFFFCFVFFVSVPHLAQVGDAGERRY